ncbi:MAG: RnfABCDGE type electron transport complex subunit G [Prolixibacteraceae bacterium]|nr:RnfABCDGE type electron transport complex subunit G [Prolixibacteraceae bacterium]
MAKLESSFKNMLISLLGVTLLASAILGVVNDATITPIAKAELEKQTKAITAVLPAFDHLGVSYKVLPIDGKDSMVIFPAFDANEMLVGSAIKSYTYNGFSGYIEVMVGIEPSGIVSGYQVLKHAETPGLGTKMSSWFNDSSKPGQNVIGRSLAAETLKVSKDGGQIDAITAATISSRAFLDAVNRAYTVINQGGSTTQNK